MEICVQDTGNSVISHQPYGMDAILQKMKLKNRKAKELHCTGVGGPGPSPCRVEWSPVGGV